MNEPDAGVKLVQSYIERGFKVVFWPAIGEWKGPREPGWIDKTYTLEDYHEGDRVGIMHGVEIAPGRYLIDVDIDWAPGVEIAKAMLPATAFIWGRTSKRISHLLYVTPDVVPMLAYKDIGKDGKTLIEFRADKHQAMAPPSDWEKEGRREPLSFVVAKEPAFIESAAKLKERVTLAAVGMLLASHLGRNGFGHATRLAWAGFLLRAGVSADDLVTMGRAISAYCNNLEVGDVRTVVESTATALTGDRKKVAGGPALAKIIGERGPAVIARINEWLGKDAQGFVRNTKGAIVPKNYHNIKTAVELLKHELSYDEFAEQPMIDGRPLEDPQLRELIFDIETTLRFQPPLEYFKLAVADLAYRNRFHPVRQYLDALRWDDVPRINTWIHEAAEAEDNAYVRAVSSIMLIAAVRRIRHPGCKYDEMVVWESPQGTNKSSAAAALCPNPSWFSDDLRLNLFAKELIEATLGKWIIEASDLAGKRKTEIEQLKAMLSRQRDGPARMAYAHFPVHRPRHFIIIGTTNSSVYLTDSTGGRRFWPITVGRFDLEWVHGNRDQLWAEACVREARGESIRLSEALWPVATIEQERRQELDPWEPLLRRFLLQQVEPSEGDGKRRVVADDLWAEIGIPKDRRDRVASLRIGDVMHRLGFKRTRVRQGGEVQVGFVQEDERLSYHEEGEPGDERELFEARRRKDDPPAHDDDDAPF